MYSNLLWFSPNPGQLHVPINLGPILAYWQRACGTVLFNSFSCRGAAQLGVAELAAQAAAAAAAAEADAAAAEAAALVAMLWHSAAKTPLFHDAE